MTGTSPAPLRRVLRTVDDETGEIVERRFLQDRVSGEVTCLETGEVMAATQLDEILGLKLPAMPS
jgi:hypothetical protein